MAKTLINLRKKLKQNETTIGAWMQIPSPEIAEILAFNNYDWITIDLEHGSIENSDLPNITRAIELGNCLPIARVAIANEQNCRRALDLGAKGLILPMINSPSQLKDILHYCSWPPKGKRGVGYSRANLYGKSFYEYNYISQNPFIVAQIEHVEAVNNLEAISKCKGLDAILIGPYDLSASINKTGKFNDKEYINLINKIFKICKKNKIPFGYHVVDPDLNKLKKIIKKGCNFIAYSTDAMILNKFTINPIYK